MLKVEDDGPVICAVYPRACCSFQGKTLELMALHEMFTQILSYKGLTNFCVSSAACICKDNNLVHLMMPDPTMTLVRSGASEGSSTATFLR